MLAASSAPLLSLETLWSMRASTLERVFDAYGAPSSSTLGVALDLAALEKVLVRASASDELADAAAKIEALATPLGQTALYQAAAVTGFACDDGWNAAVSPADLAGLVVALGASDPAIAEIVELGLARVAREFPARTWYQFVGREAFAIGAPARFEKKLTAAVAAWCQKTGRGEFARARPFGDARKAHFEIAHSDRTSAAVVAVDAAPSMVPLRTIRSHLFTYEAPTRRLFVWSAQPEVVLELVELFARTVVGDESWFFSEPAVALEALQTHAASKKLPAAGAPFSSVALIGLNWDTWRGHTLSPRGDDAYEALASHAIAIDGGRIRLATLRANAAAGARGVSSADLSMRPPYTITCSAPELAPALLRYADKLTLTRATRALRDLWARAPFVDSPAGFSDLPDYEACVSLGILVPTQSSRRAAHPKHLHAGRIAKVWPTRRRGTSYAIPDDPLFPPFFVSDAQLVDLAIDFETFGKLVAEACGLRGPGKALDHDGVLVLGDWAPDGARIRYVLPTCPLGKAAIARLVMEAKGAHVVALVPEGRSSGLVEVRLPNLAGPYRSILRDAVAALGIEEDVPPSAYVAPDTRLVLHEKRREIWLDGILCTKMHDNHFRSLIAFARAPLQTATSRQIGKAIGDWSDDSAARRTIPAIGAAFRRSFEFVEERAPSDVDRIVVKVNTRGLYRLAVTVEVV